MYNPHNYNPAEQYSLSEIREAQEEYDRCKAEVEAYLQKYSQQEPAAPEEINKETEEQFFGI